MDFYDLGTKFTSIKANILGKTPPNGHYECSANSRLGILVPLGFQGTFQQIFQFVFLTSVVPLSQSRSILYLLLHIGGHEV